MPTDDELYALLYPESPVTAPVYRPEPTAFNVQDVELPDVEAEIGLGTPASSSVSTSTSQGMGVGVSQSGFSPQKYEQVQKAGKGLQGKYQAIENKHTAEADQLSARYQEASQNEYEAIRQRGDIERRKAEEEARAYRQEAEYTRQFAQREAELQAEAQVEQQAYLADYKKMMQEIRATTVNPAKLFADMTVGERAGTLVTAFVHDFLGTKGIKTSAMDTINRAVEQSIDAQIANLNNKKTVASGFRDMWEMQRAMSASDEEARMRMHGIALQSFKDDVASKMAKFNSELAGANLLSATAEIDKKLLDNEVNLNNVAQQRIMSEKQLALTEHGQNLQAAQHAASIKLQRDEMEANRIAKEEAARGKAQEELEARLIIDPSKNQSGTTRGWIVRKGVTDKQREAIQTKINTNTQLIELTNEYASLAKDLGKRYDGPMGKYINRDPEVARLEQIRSQIIDEIVAARAATTFTEGYLKRIEEKLPKNSLLTSEKASQMAGQLVEIMSKGIDTELSGWTEEAPPELLEMVSPTPRVQSGVHGPEDEAIPTKAFGSENREVARDWRDNLKPKEYGADKLAGKVNSDVDTTVGINKLTPTARKAYDEHFVDSYGRGRVPTEINDIASIYDIATNLDQPQDQRDRALEVLYNLSYDKFGNQETGINGIAQYYLNEALSIQSSRQGSAIATDVPGSPYQSRTDNRTVGQVFEEDYLSNSAQSLYAR